MPDGAPGSVEDRHEQSQEQKDIVLKQTKILEQIRDGVKDNSKSIESSKQSGSSEGGMGILGSLIRGAAITSALAIGVDLLGQAIWGKKAWEEVRKTFFDGLKTAIDATKEFVMNTLPVALESAFKWIREEGPAIWETIKVGAKDTWEILKEGGNLMIEWIPIIKDTIVNMAEEISDIISEISAFLKYFGFIPQETTREKHTRIREETRQAKLAAGPTRAVQYQPTNVATEEQITAAEVFQNNQRNSQGDIDSLTPEDFANTPKTIDKILEADSKREVPLFNGTEFEKRNQAGQAIDAIRRRAQMPENTVVQDIASGIITGVTGGTVNDFFDNNQLSSGELNAAHNEYWKGKTEYNLDGTVATPEDIRLASVYSNISGSSSQAQNQAAMFKSRGVSAKEIHNIYQKGRQKIESQVPEPKTFRDRSSSINNGFTEEVPQNTQVPEASPVKAQKTSEALNMSANEHFNSTVAPQAAMASNITNNVVVNAGSSSATGTQGADSSTVLYSLNNPETLAQQVAWDINRMSLA
jgi:hypothetical protein